MTDDVLPSQTTLEHPTGCNCTPCQEHQPDTDDVKTSSVRSSDADLKDAANDHDQLHKTTGPRVQEHADDIGTSVDAGELIDVIDEIPTLNDAHPDQLWTTDMILPGFGETREDCGENMVFFCSDCCSMHHRSHLCNRSTCPFCAPNWARKDATRRLHKLEQVRRIRQSNRSNHQRFHHITISPPSDWEPDYEDEWKALVDVAKRISDKVDLEGYAFYHPYSGKGEDDLGKWKQRLFQGRDWNGDVLDELKFRPHIHLIVVGHKVPGGALTRTIESETGFVLHRITKGNSSISLYDHHDVARALTYCASHVGLYETEHTTQAAIRGIGDKLAQPSPKVQIYDRNDLDQEGVGIENVKQDQKLLRQVDAIVRRVSPITLGLSYDDLACVSQRTTREIEESATDDHREKVSISKAEASQSSTSFGPRSLDSSASSDPDGPSIEDLCGDSGVWDSDVDEILRRYLSDDEQEQVLDEILRRRDDLDRSDARALLEREAETEHCEGRLLPIYEAPKYLNDPEWVAAVDGADKLRECFIEWAKRTDWGPDLDALDDPPP